MEDVNICQLFFFVVAPNDFEAPPILLQSVWKLIWIRTHDESLQKQQIQVLLWEPFIVFPLSSQDFFVQTVFWKKTITPEAPNSSEK